jgi:hypothetical protein
MFNFARCGVIWINSSSEDAVFEAAMEVCCADGPQPPAAAVLLKQPATQRRRCRGSSTGHEAHTPLRTVSPCTSTCVATNACFRLLACTVSSMLSAVSSFPQAGAEDIVPVPTEDASPSTSYKVRRCNAMRCDAISFL